MSTDFDMSWMYIHEDSSFTSACIHYGWLVGFRSDYKPVYREAIVKPRQDGFCSYSYSKINSLT